MPFPDQNADRLAWSLERIAPYQLTALRETVAAAGQSPHYGPLLRDVKVESLADLARLPLTTKEDVRAASPFGLVAVQREKLFQYHESFGTTGTPASSWMTEHDLHAYAAQINQAAAEMHPGDRVLVRFPYAISVPAHIVTQAARNRGACVVPVSSRSTISPYGRVIDLLAKLEVTVLACLPTEALWLAEAARLSGRDPARDFPHLRALLTAGELLTDVRRQRISAAWNAPVFNMYGCTEAGNIAADCPRGKLHLAWDHFLLESLDPATSQPVPPGQMGVAVLTTLTREAMPLLRYILGDYIRLRPGDSCGCGRQSPVIDHHGRDFNRFEFDGRGFFVRDIEERILPAPVEAIGDFWLLEVRPDHVVFRAEAAALNEALYRDLEARVLAELDLPLKIAAMPPGSMLNRQRLTPVEPVAKPRPVAMVPNANAGPVTIDDLFQAGG
ncbi:MAG: phenylacetate--CoA ligase family protein [Pirellulales bacterium]